MENVYKGFWRVISEVWENFSGKEKEFQQSLLQCLHIISVVWEVQRKEQLQGKVHNGQRLSSFVHHTCLILKLPDNIIPTTKLQKINISVFMIRQLSLWIP